jgi:hypothetical protein
VRRGGQQVVVTRLAGQSLHLQVLHHVTDTTGTREKNIILSMMSSDRLNETWQQQFGQSNEERSESECIGSSQNRIVKKIHTVRWWIWKTFPRNACDT